MTAGKIPKYDLRHMLVRCDAVPHIVANVPTFAKMQEVLRMHYEYDLKEQTDQRIYIGNQEFFILIVPGIPSFAQSRIHVRKYYMNEDDVVCDSIISLDGTKRIITFSRAGRRMRVATWIGDDGNVAGAYMREDESC